MATQKVFISPYSTLHNNIGNCLQFQAEIDAIVHDSTTDDSTTDDNYDLIINTMFGWQAIARKPQSLGKWQSSILLYAISGGVHGYGPMHLLSDISLMTYCLDKKADTAVVSKIVKSMTAHPDRARAISWKGMGYALKSKDEEILSDLRRDLAQLKKEARDNGQ